MSLHDTFAIYIKARPTGEVLTARYEVHDRDTFACIEAAEMTTTYLDSFNLEHILAALREAAIMATLNAPSEAQLKLMDGVF